MRRLIVAGAAGLLCASIAQACDDHHGTCEIEDWRWNTTLGDFLTVEGVTTCDKGLIRIRLYDGEGDDRKFVGVATGFVSGHTFDAIAENIETKPQALSIKYSIESMG